MKIDLSYSRSSPLQGTRLEVREAIKPLHTLLQQCASEKEAIEIVTQAMKVLSHLKNTIERDYPREKCPLCKGSGRSIQVDAIEANGKLINPRPATCMVCDGTGWRPEEPDDTD